MAGSKDSTLRVVPSSGANLNALSPTERARLDRILSRPIQFVDHPDFESAFLTANDQESSFLEYNQARRVLACLTEACHDRSPSLAHAKEMISVAARIEAIRSRLAEEHRGLVMAMAKRSRFRGLDFDDMVSEGSLALLRSIDHFDCSLGYRFSSYACRAIHESFSRLAGVRFKEQARCTNGLEDHIVPDSTPDAHLHDAIADLRHVLAANQAELNPREIKVLRARFDLDDARSGQTLEQVSRNVGVSKERVRQIQNRALQKLRVAMGVAA